ncbi:MAG TPA: response regulator, partial [Candidatus Desulfofervidus auxilii]|nr:response regulator [Candidatus Desulfofervidus auxilii]
ETLSHIFEPFFTTKEAGKGTGLGLSTVYGIVKQTGGYIYVYSQPGKGTTFEIYFPILQKMPVVKKESAMEFHLPSIKATILVVEDEEEIRNLLREMLEHLGYEVIIAETGMKALRLFDKYKDKINLIITDVVMPQISGKELVEKIKKEYPEIKVLYMSGYPENVIAHYGVLEEDINFISKPFTLMELTKKLKKIFNV